MLCGVILDDLGAQQKYEQVGKTSAFIGPLVSSAIITASDGNANMPFAFLFSLGVVSTIFLWCVDVEKSRVECAEFVRAERDKDVFELVNPAKVARQI
jgi:hypothetical protein